MEFSVRIVSVDWHLTRSEHDSSRLPEIRVYGSTQFGQTACCHVRGFFPYLLVDVDGLDLEQGDLESFRKLFNEAMSSGETVARSYIHSMEIVQRRPIYGYHRHLHRMLRINLFDPNSINQLALLLRSGALCNGHRFAVQHAHLPYPLQFFIEHRLFGMNWMHVSPGGYRFRAPVPSRSEYAASTAPDDLWTLESVPGGIVSGTPRESSCRLELDVVASYIRNAHDPLPTGLTVPSLADVWRDLNLSSQAICSLSLDARHEYEYSEIEMAYRARLEALVARSLHTDETQCAFQPCPLAFSLDSDLALCVCTQQSDEVDELVADLHENRFGTRDVIIDDDSSGSEQEARDLELDTQSDDDMTILNHVLDSSDDEPVLSNPEQSQRSAPIDPLLSSQMTAPSSQRDDAVGQERRRQRKTQAPTLAQEPFFSDPEHRLKEIAYIRRDGRRIRTDALFLEKGVSGEDRARLPTGGCVIRPRIHPPTSADLMSRTPLRAFKLVSEVGHIDSSGRVVPATGDVDDRVGIREASPAVADDARAPAGHEDAPAPSSSLLSQVPSDAFSHRRQHLRVAAIESLHRNRGALEPDPKIDPVLAVVIGVEIDGRPDLLRVLINSHAMPVPGRFNLGYDAAKASIKRFGDEAALLDGVVDDVVGIDPDIVVAYEMQKQSLGYLSERASALGIADFLHRISRLLPKPHPAVASHARNAWGERKASGLHVPGRIVLNLWRVLRSELKLTTYTLHVVAFTLLGVRVPSHSWANLNRMVASGLGGVRRALDDRLARVLITFALLSNQNLIQRTSELARLFGIDFFSVLSRGSQYRVESVMVRQGVAEDFAFASASPDQVAEQSSMECVPLVMEPRSAMYSDPDFQSLYPSIMISRDICYSTCLGSIVQIEKALDTDAPHIALGAAGATSPDLASLRTRRTWVSPNGVVFVDRHPDHARTGLLPRLLRDLLETRVAIKKAMKSIDCDDPRWREMNAKQFGIKLLANVTYGYTAAGFSGRMPCAEIADAIVQTGRETLEKAIDVVEQDPDWDAEVVYADTDSLFVSVPGRTLAQAFCIGQEIGDRVTAMNPPPVKLVLEKVYQPCLLVAKKRYVGLKHQNPGGRAPVIDAKGLEVVRRDGCPLTVSAMDNCIKLLFKKDLSCLRRYLETLWTRIRLGQISTMQYVFAKEVRLGTYRVVPPAAQIAMERMRSDPRSFPLYAERVPYVVVCGNKHDRLTDLVVSPDRLLDPNSGLYINADYYITKQILSSLNRITSLVHINIWHWWRELPRDKPLQAAPPRPWTIDRYCVAQRCTTCGAPGLACLCRRAAEMPGLCDAVESHRLQAELQLHNRLCKECSGCDRQGPVLCDALDCPSYHERARLSNRLAAMTANL